MEQQDTRSRRKRVRLCPEPAAVVTTTVAATHRVLHGELAAIITSYLPRRDVCAWLACSRAHQSLLWLQGKGGGAWNGELAATCFMASIAWSASTDACTALHLVWTLREHLQDGCILSTPNDAAVMFDTLFEYLLRTDEEGPMVHKVSLAAERALQFHEDVLVHTIHRFAHEQATLLQRLWDMVAHKQQEQQAGHLRATRALVKLTAACNPAERWCNSTHVSMLTDIAPTESSAWNRAVRGTIVQFLRMLQTQPRMLSVPHDDGDNDAVVTCGVLAHVVTLTSWLKPRQLREICTPMYDALVTDTAACHDCWLVALFRATADRWPDSVEMLLASKRVIKRLQEVPGRLDKMLDAVMEQALRVDMDTLRATAVTGSAFHTGVSAVLAGLDVRCPIDNGTLCTAAVRRVPRVVLRAVLEQSNNALQSLRNVGRGDTWTPLNLSTLLDVAVQMQLQCLVHAVVGFAEAVPQAVHDALTWQCVETAFLRLCGTDRRQDWMTMRSSLWSMLLKMLYIEGAACLSEEAVDEGMVIACKVGGFNAIIRMNREAKRVQSRPQRPRALPLPPPPPLAPL